MKNKSKKGIGKKFKVWTDTENEQLKKAFNLVKPDFKNRWGNSIDNIMRNLKNLKKNEKRKI